MKEGWQSKTLGEICEIERGGSPRPIQNFITTDSNGINWIKIGDATASGKYIYKTVEKIKPEGVKRSRMVYEGDFILSNSMSFGRPYIMKTTGCIHDGWLVLRQPKIDSDYLYYVLSSNLLFEQFDRLAAGSTVRNLNIGLAKSVEIPYPPPAEQLRIVGILEEALESIANAKANAEQNVQNSLTLFDEFLNIAIQGKLVSQIPDDDSVEELVNQIEKLRTVAVNRGKAKPQKTVELRNGNNGQFALPDNWKWAQLESLTLAISDGVHKKPIYRPDGIPFVTVRNLTAGRGICFKDLNYISRADHTEFIKRTHPEKGDILITKDGTIGVVRLIETDMEFSIFVSVALIKPIMKEMGPYLLYALRASCVQSQIVPQGAALKHLYLVDLRRLSIPLPPLAEQKRIVAKLEKLSEETRRLELIYQRKVEAFGELKQSLLHRAFSGEL